MTTLDVVPQEILEHIACFLATDQVLGPPSHLTPLLLANRKINARLSIKENPHFYAVVFSRKFDVGTAKRRLGDEALSSEVLAGELKRRFSLLKRIRSRKDCLVEPGSGQRPDDILDDILVTSYLMVLENDGNNKPQLLQYAQLDKWLKDYLFHADGASGTVQRVRSGNYPLTSARASLAMWLLWFFLRPSEYLGASDSPDTPSNILKALALSAPQYNLTHIPWTEHSPSGITTHPTMAVTWYSRPLPLTPPPLAIPAILSFLALVNRRKSIPAVPSDPKYRISPIDEWKAEWGRAVLCGTKPSELTDCFVPGSIEGVWEGFFTYTEFTAYAAMLGGADPQFIQKSIVGRHQQTWKLREWHLISDQEGGVDSLSAGDPLFSYFPVGCKLSETSEDLSAKVTLLGVNFV
ncbi:hypothetical protein MD484_g6406, partial [Candolleomyces efflorescens]